MFSLQPAYTVIEQFLFGSLSAVETIASLSNQWLHDKVSQYSSEEMIPDNERKSYNLTIDTLLDLSLLPDDYSLMSDNLSNSLREKVFVLLSQCVMGSEHKRKLWRIINAYACYHAGIVKMFQVYTACFQLLKLISETWSVELLTDLSKIAYIDMWSIIDYLSQCRLKLKPKNMELIYKYAELEALFTSIMEVLARRIPNGIQLNCPQLKECAELLEEAIRVNFHRYELMMEYYHCLCSFRHVFVYLSNDVQQSILVNMNDYIKL